MSSVVFAQPRGLKSQEVEAVVALLVGVLGALPVQDRRLVIGVSLIAAGVALLALQR